MGEALEHQEVWDTMDPAIRKVITDSLIVERDQLPPEFAKHINDLAVHAIIESYDDSPQTR